MNLNFRTRSFSANIFDGTFNVRKRTFSYNEYEEENENWFLKTLFSPFNILIITPISFVKTHFLNLFYKKNNKTYPIYPDIDID